MVPIDAEPYYPPTCQDILLQGPGGSVTVCVPTYTAGV